MKLDCHERYSKKLQKISSARVGNSTEWWNEVMSLIRLHLVPISYLTSFTSKLLSTSYLFPEIKLPSVKGQTGIAENRIYAGGNLLAFGE